MRKPQAQIVKKWGSVRPGYITATRAFLHNDGSVTVMSGVEHVRACKVAKSSLHDYLCSGGVRVQIYRNQLAFETCGKKFTHQQLSVIKGTIRRGVYIKVVFAINRKATIIEDFQRVTVAKCKEVLSC